MIAAWGHPLAVEVVIRQKIRPGSGIGSSSASSAAAVVGLNELLGRPFGEQELITFAMEGERLVSGGTAHADNAGPAVTGGIMLIRGYDPLDYIRIPVPERLYAAVIHPHITVNTVESRAVLRQEVPLRDAVSQWGNVGGLVAGLLTADMGLIGRSLKDAIAEPYRKHFIPGYDSLKAALSGINGLLGSRLTMGFFFSSRMLPWLLLFVLVMSVVPAWYISRRLSRLSFSQYRTLYGGRRKQRFVAVLVTVQFAISIGLLLATLTARRQMRLTERQADRYADCIEIGDGFGAPLAPLKAELEKRVQGIESVTLSNGPVLNAWIRQLTVKRPDGSEVHTNLLVSASMPQWPTCWPCPSPGG